MPMLITATAVFAFSSARERTLTILWAARNALEAKIPDARSTQIEPADLARRIS